ncbi:hypothetical protein, partial [Staphylococcus pettenkoferi]|uniref:hypothetical protein n=1 Tax=Staphylococcus pettenkoferi TaxID=170573 RepID=UPI001C92D45A
KEVGDEMVEEGKNSRGELMYREECSGEMMLDNKGLVGKMEKEVRKGMDCKYKCKEATWRGLVGG